MDISEINIELSAFKLKTHEIEKYIFGTDIKMTIDINISFVPKIIKIGSD